MVPSSLIGQTLSSPLVQFLGSTSLFVGNPTAGETAAKLITLTKSCNRLHIDPFAYLQDVYARLPTMTPEELPSLLPDRWLQDHPQHLLPYRVQEAIERAQRAHEQRAARRVAA